MVSAFFLVFDDSYNSEFDLSLDCLDVFDIGIDGAGIDAWPITFTLGVFGYCGEIYSDTFTMLAVAAPTPTITSVQYDDFGMSLKTTRPFDIRY